MTEGEARPLAILLGAGASHDAGVPISGELTERLVAAVADPTKTSGPDATVLPALRFIYGQLIAHEGVMGRDPTVGIDVERLYTAVDLLAHRDDLEASPFVAAWHHRVDEVDRPAFPRNFDGDINRALTGFGSLEAIVKNAINSQTGSSGGETYAHLSKVLIDHLPPLLDVEPTPGVGYLHPLVRRAEKPGGLTIATLNYDQTIERACTETGISFSTGIDEWSRTGAWGWSDDGVRLLKLHGSVDWIEWTPHSYDAAVMDARRYSSEPAIDESTPTTRRPALLFGQRNKLTARGPYLELLAEFATHLSSAKDLLVIGYSFRDEHINEFIEQWLSKSPERRITVVDPAFNAHPNIRGFRSDLMRLEGRFQLVATGAADAIALHLTALGVG